MKVTVSMATITKSSASYMYILDTNFSHFILILKHVHEYTELTQSNILHYFLLKAFSDDFKNSNPDEYDMKVQVSINCWKMFC